MASTALASPALARDNSWYVELDGGPMIVEDIEFDVGANANAVSIDSDTGYDFGGIVGYDFGGFRLEAEASYREADPDNLTVNTGTIPATNTTTGVARAGSYDFVAGDTNALSFMMNGMLDFGEDDGLQGFIGGGVGVARVKSALSVNSVGPGFVNDSDTGFAWQALAGVRAPITDNWDVGVKYRFFNADNVNMVDAAGRDVEGRFRSHSLLGTFAYNFGGVEPMPEPIVAPPPPPPPPPPPVVQAVCNKGPYIVFFDWDRSDITPEAATILDNAVSAYGNCANVPIMLAGHTDRSGSVQYNMGLAERRNDSVRTYLGSRGIPGGAITGQAFGESMPRVPTADGVRELQNRRVEITYGPGSGM
jgi:outer membrane protein OmpA-like peptidoglycan-associated protein/opacity protein-like surface antigen